MNNIWLSPHEAFVRRENVEGIHWLNYKDLLNFEEDELKLKTREMLELDDFTCHWFTYVQLLEHYKVDKKNNKFVNETAQFEMELCTND